MRRRRRRWEEEETQGLPPHTFSQILTDDTHVLTKEGSPALPQAPLQGESSFSAGSGDSSSFCPMVSAASTLVSDSYYTAEGQGQGRSQEAQQSSTMAPQPEQPRPKPEAAGPESAAAGDSVHASALAMSPSHSPPASFLIASISRSLGPGSSL